MSFFTFAKKNKKNKLKLSRKIDKESYSLVFNIGSGSVSGGLIKFTEKAGENVLFYAKEIVPLQEEISILKHVRLMKSSLTILASKIQFEGLSNINYGRKNILPIDKIFYVFSSPWCVSQTKTIRIREPKPFRVTETYINNIVDKQEKEFQNSNSMSGKIIEKKIIQIKANGYVVDDIYNKIAQSLEISVFFTVVPESILQIVEEAVSKTFAVKNVWCHSLALSIFSIIRNLFPQKEDFIHVDISEEMTDIFVIKDNVIATSASIPFGRNYFIRELAKDLKVSSDVADSMINMHTNKINDELANIKLSVAMDTAARNWLNNMTEVLDSFKEKIYVPEDIFLVSNNDLFGFIKGKLEKQDFRVLQVDNKNVKSKVVLSDLIFRLELMFLDNIYKI